MRTIKFRGKRIDNGKWAYGVPMDDCIIIDIYGGDAGSTLAVAVEVHPETVGQFTGLLDKNGKEIYEGDIVETHRMGAYSGVYEIKWNNESALFERHNINKESVPESTMIYHLEDTVIIGNIHEVQS